MTLLEGLLHGDEEVDAVDDELDELHLGEPQPVGVGDVERPAHSSRVHAAGPALLQAQVLENLYEGGGDRRARGLGEGGR